MYFWLILTIFSGVNTNLGVERHQRGLNPPPHPPPPKNRALLLRHQVSRIIYASLSIMKLHQEMNLRLRVGENGNTILHWFPTQLVQTKEQNNENILFIEAKCEEIESQAPPRTRENLHSHARLGSKTSRSRTIEHFDQSKCHEFHCQSHDYQCQGHEFQCQNEPGLNEILVWNRYQTNERVQDTIDGTIIRANR